MAMLSREQAVVELVDGAIGAWFDGRYACAITLAGAAETGIPRLESGTSTFDALREVVMKFGDCSERQAADLMNDSRNWLKHFSENKSNSISDDYAWIYVLRSYLQFRLVYKETSRTVNMMKFEAKIDEHVKPIHDAAHALSEWSRHIGENISAKLALFKK